MKDMWQCNQHEYWISEVIVEYDLQKSNSLVEQVHRLLVRITFNVHYTYTTNTAHFSPIVIAMSYFTAIHKLQGQLSQAMIMAEKNDSLSGMK
jgi:hypothetical protein